MKNTGITRKIDDLGRVVIPIELREALGIEKQDVLEVFIDNERIVLEKKVESCIFCNEVNGLSKVKNKNVCSNCLDEMNSF